MLLTRFNSTLVQLKAIGRVEEAIKFTCFNSTLVQLKALLDINCVIVLSGFNSTLVQLKVTPGKAYIGLPTVSILP